MAAFEELGVMPELSKALESMDWLLPTEIQSEAIPLILGGGDVLMASETGTGKTGAFCIPIVQVVHEQILQSSNESVRELPNKMAKTDRWALSISDRAPDLVLSTDLLKARSKSGNWQGCRSNKGIKRSAKDLDALNNCKAYYEVHFADPGLARVGWSLPEASFDLGTDCHGWGYGGTAKKSNSRQFTDYGLPFGEKFDTIGCILNLKTCEISFMKNGRNMGVAFKLPNQILDKRGIFPTICVKNAGCELRFCATNDVNDYKPNDCIWISDLGANFVVGRTDNRQSGSFDDEAPLAIILEPSRELAKQTFDCIQSFSKRVNVRVALMVGGGREDKIPSKDHIIVCTPGRLAESTSKHQIKLHNVHFFILDEADGLIQQGFQNLIKTTYNQLPKMFNTGRRLQTICCSATLHNPEVRKLAQQIMYFPIWIDLKGEDSVPDTVHHVVLRIDPKQDLVFKELEGLFQTDGVHANDVDNRILFDARSTLSRPEEHSEAVKLMKFYYTVKAIESLNMEQGIIFCRTKLDCDNLEDFMNNMNRQSKSRKFHCVKLHSSLSQRDRTDNLNSFKAKQVKFLICTDVAARGIDIKCVPFVIQVTLPDDKANYIHRIGRVGRADRMGLALSLVATVPEKVWYHSCNKRECHNTRLVEKGGCCKWFDELSMLAEIEEHLKCTIQEIRKDFKLQIDEYDGKVVYGAKKLESTLTYEGHVEQLRGYVESLSELELKLQRRFIKSYV